MNYDLISCIVIKNMDIIFLECVIMYYLCCLFFKVNILRKIVFIWKWLVCLSIM